jgi:putative peptide zinc metalloprotease protein
LTLRYFHFDEKQQFILGLMDGARALEEIRQAYEAKYRPRRLSLEELEDFARQLLESNLVLNVSPGAAQLAIEQTKKQNRRWWLSQLNIFCIKIPLASPARWLARCRLVGNVIFSYWFLAGTIGLFLAALGLLVTHWEEFVARLPSHTDFFSPQTIFLFWITLGLVKVLHELGHAFCCQRMGAGVHEIGVLVLFFFPALYCNVSESWTLPSKWRRIAVAAAGIYVELIVASLATFLWWFSDSTTLVHNFCFALMAVCSVNTAWCNGNPLMRFDGYYVFSDWLEIPNLAQQASQELQKTALGWLGIKHVREGDNNSLLFWFGLASALYRWYVVAVTLYILLEFFKHRQLPMVGSLLVGVALMTLVGAPVYRFGHWLRQLGKFPEMKVVRVWLTLAVPVVLAAGFFLAPLPRKIYGTALVQVTPEQTQRIVIPETEGVLRELRVRDGQQVRAGEIIALLANPKLEIKLRLNDADQALRHQQQNALVAELVETGASKDDRFPDWQQCEQELKALVQARQTLQEQRERLVLRAPIAGVVMGLPPPEDQGKWLEKGAELCRIGNSGALRALVLVDPADHADIRSGAPATIRVHGSGSRQYGGFVTGVAQVEAKNIPTALSSRVAGDVATRYDAATRSDKPHGQHYLVSVQFSASDDGVHPGVLGRVKIETEARTLWWRLRRYLGTAFNWGL